jgi:hypothetical protein
MGVNTREELIALLDALEAQLPGLIAANPDPGDFWVEFAGQVDVIEDHAGDHCAMVKERIRAMLAEHGRYLATIEDT